MSYYDAYYAAQIGGGRSVHNVFVGSRGQRGHGVGSFLAGLFRRALPFIAKGARAVGKEAIRAGMNVIDDVTENNMSFQDSLKNRMVESGLNLKRKATEKIKDMMSGSGYNSVPFKLLRQSHRRSRSRNISKTRLTKKKKTKKSTRTRVKKKVKRLAKNKRRAKRKKNKKKSRGKKKKNTDIFD